MIVAVWLALLLCLGLAAWSTLSRQGSVPLLAAHIHELPRPAGPAFQDDIDRAWILALIDDVGAGGDAPGRPKRLRKPHPVCNRKWNVARQLCRERIVHRIPSVQNQAGSYPIRFPAHSNGSVESFSSFQKIELISQVDLSTVDTSESSEPASITKLLAEDA